MCNHAILISFVPCMHLLLGSWFVLCCWDELWAPWSQTYWVLQREACSHWAESLRAAVAGTAPPPMPASKGSRKDMGSVMGADTILGWGLRPVPCCRGDGVSGQAAFQTHTPACRLPCAHQGSSAPWLAPAGPCSPVPGWAEAAAGKLAQCSSPGMLGGAGLRGRHPASWLGLALQACGSLFGIG